MSDNCVPYRQDTSFAYTCKNDVLDPTSPIGAPGEFDCLLQGIDMLEVSYFLDTSISDLRWDELYLAKVSAAEARRTRWSAVALGSLDFLVMPHGTQRYGLLLKHRHFTVQLGERMTPNCIIKFTSEGLWQNGVAGQLAAIEGWIKSMSLVPNRPPVVGRADWAYDFHVPEVDFELDHFVSKAKKDRVWRSDRKLQSFTFGKGALVIRVYDKSAEIREQSDKAWFHDLWGREDSVWRAEFQTRREHLKRYGIRTPAELLALQNDVLKQAAGFHTTLRRPGKDSNRSRWPRHPLWSSLLRAIDRGQQHGLIRSFDPANSEEWRRFQQAKSLVGCLKGLAAMDAIVRGQDTPLCLEEFLATRLPALAEEHVSPQNWLDDVQAKIVRHRMGHR